MFAGTCTNRVLASLAVLVTIYQGEPSLPPHDEPLMGESALSQLRARLDPLYNPPPPPMPPLDLSGTTEGGSDVTDHQTREDGGTLV